jgi:hypothetical protein
MVIRSHWLLRPKRDRAAGIGGDVRRRDMKMGCGWFSVGLD